MHAYHQEHVNFGPPLFCNVFLCIKSDRKVEVENKKQHKHTLSLFIVNLYKSWGVFSLLHTFAFKIQL